MIRRTALVALAITAALAPSATAASKEGKTLDGQRVTEHRYSGSLAGPTVLTGLVMNAESEKGTEPDETWCTPETCDRTAIRLKLPTGRQSGRLVVELTQTGGTGSMHLIVNDSNGESLPGQNGGMKYVATRLRPGDIEVVVFDDAAAGQVDFEVEVRWQANPPHRSSSAPS